MIGDEFDLVAIGISKVGGAVIGATREGMPIGKEDRPTVLRGICSETFDGIPAARMEGKMVQAWTMPIVIGADHVR